MRTETFPTLPQGFSRRDVIALFADVGREIGLSPRLTDILTRLIGSTDPDAWTDETKEPIFYGRQEVFAKKLCITPRALRSHEKSLQRHGLVEKRTLANGRRDRGTHLGLVFTPIIEAFTELLAVREARNARNLRIKHLKATRSLRWATFRDELDRLSERDLGHPDIQEMISERAGWPRTDTLMGMSEARLAAHLEAATALCDRLAAWIENYADSTCKPEETFRSYIQEDNKKILTEDCNVTDPNRSAGTPAPTDLKMSSPTGDATGKENKLQAETEALQGMFSGDYGLTHAVSLASPEFKFEIEGRSDQHLEYAFVEAAAARIAPLGINISAWAAACERMGRGRAALCVMLLDANTDHPTRPVLNAGGALRGMIKAHNASRLNLIGSLIGLHRRRGL